MTSDERAAERLPLEEADLLSCCMGKVSVAVGQAIESGITGFCRRRRR